MQTRYVNTASTAGGNGTTNATSGANRAYATLAEWEAARQGTLTEVEEVICEGSAADTSHVLIDGWTTSAANYILIRTTQANRHNGRYDTSKYRLEVSNSQSFYVAEYFVRIDGLQFSHPNNDTWNQEGVMFWPDISGVGPASTDCRISNSIAYNCGSGSIGLRQIGCRVTYTNCISYGNSSHGFRVADTGDGANATYYNCIAAANADQGFSLPSGTTTARNCYAGGNSSADWSATPGTASNNASADGSHGSTVAYSTSSGAYFTNVTAGSQNFDIGSSSALRDAGYDLSGTFTTDILGQTRGATWDIGPFEYQAAATAGIPPRSIAALTAVSRASSH